MLEEKITLLLPGYKIATDQSANGRQSQPDTYPNSPSIDSLQWDQGLTQLPWQALFCRLLGMHREQGESLPAAQFSGLNIPLDESMVCADPIHLRADRDTASLIPPQQLALTEFEADELLASLNNFLQEDGIRLFRDTVTRWFMVGLDGHDLKSFPTAFLAYRNGSTFLPSGDNASHWRRLMTEIQMLLHAHPINTERESRGKLPVNSVWIWGGARLPVQKLNAGASMVLASTRVYAQNGFVQSLCSHMGVPYRALTEFDTLTAQNAETLRAELDENAGINTVRQCVLVDTTIIDAWLGADEMGMAEARSIIDKRWLHPLIKQVEQGCFAEIEILTEHGLHGLCNARVLTDHAARYAAAQPRWWRRVLARFQQ